MRSAPCLGLPTDGLVYAIGYTRVSDRLQKTAGASLETQDAAIRTFAEDRGWVLVDVIEEVFSGYYLGLLGPPEKFTTLSPQRSLKREISTTLSLSFASLEQRRCCPQGAQLPFPLFGGL